jgi:hypothetical protein
MVMEEIKQEIMDKFNISDRFFKNGYFLYLEFLTKHVYDFNILKVYLKILWFEFEGSLFKKIEITQKLIKYYLKVNKTMLVKRPHF